MALSRVRDFGANVHRSADLIRNQGHSVKTGNQRMKQLGRVFGRQRANLRLGRVVRRASGVGRRLSIALGANGSLGTCSAEILDRSCFPAHRSVVVVISHSYTSQ